MIGISKSENCMWGSVVAQPEKSINAPHGTDSIWIQSILETYSKEIQEKNLYQNERSPKPSKVVWFSYLGRYFHCHPPTPITQTVQQIMVHAKKK